MSAKDRRNAEGYSDPTAYAAMKNLNREEDRINKLRRAILNICEVAGFQKTDSVYWFTEGTLMKMENGRRYESSVSLNWLLNEDCKIRAPMKALNTTFWRGV